MEPIESTKKFLEVSFRENPHFSFNNWKIMYDHSLLVQKFSLELAKNIKCDTLVLQIGALLHDIGKIYKADEETLRKKHGELGYAVSRDFIETLNLTAVQKSNLKDILSSIGDSTERHIIKDADIIAFFADAQLHMAFKKWADERGFESELQRKLDKISKLRFNESKEIAKPVYTEMKARWGL